MRDSALPQGKDGLKAMLCGPPPMIEALARARAADWRFGKLDLAVETSAVGLSPPLCRLGVRRPYPEQTPRPAACVAQDRTLREQCGLEQQQVRFEKWW